MIDIRTPIVSRTTLVTLAWFFQRDITRRKGNKCEMSSFELKIKLNVLLLYSDRDIMASLPVGGWGATNFKTAHDTTAKITKNIVPTITSIYA